MFYFNWMYTQIDVDNSYKIIENNCIDKMWRLLAVVVAS